MATTTEIRQAPLSTSTQTQDATFESQLRDLLSRVRNVDSQSLDLASAKSLDSIPNILSGYSIALKDAQKVVESEALVQVCEKVVDRIAFGGLGLGATTIEATPSQTEEALFLVEAWLEAINSRERSKDFLSYRSSPAEGTRPMTLAQKIFAQHVVGEKPAAGLAAGDVVRVGIDWILASELSWQVGFPFLFFTAPAYGEKTC